MKNTFAPVLVGEQTGPEANEQYLEALGMYRYSDGYSHFGDSGDVYTSWVRIEDKQIIIYLTYDNCSYDRLAPNSIQSYLGPFEGREPVRYGIYINDSEAKFTQLIFDGVKKYETRTRNTLHGLNGKDVAIIRTGKGPAQIVGYCRLNNGPVCRSIKEFDAYRAKCQCNGTSYNWFMDTKVKYLYRVDCVRKCIPHPLPEGTIRHGYSWVEF